MVLPSRQEMRSKAIVESQVPKGKFCEELRNFLRHPYKFRAELNCQ